MAQPTPASPAATMEFKLASSILSLRGDPCELWVMRVKNVDTRPSRLRSFSYVELMYPDAMIDRPIWIGAEISSSAVIRRRHYHWHQVPPDGDFLFQQRNPVGYDTDREAFLGRYRDLSNPLVVETGQPLNTQAPRGNNIGSLCHEWVLEPGEEKTIIYILGMVDDRQAIPGILKRYRQPAQAEQAFQAMLTNWQGLSVALPGRYAGSGNECHAQFLESRAVPHHPLLVAFCLGL